MDADRALDRLVEKLRDSVERADARVETETDDTLVVWERGLRSGYRLALEQAEMMRALSREEAGCISAS